MGRRTLESLPGGRGLPDRWNLVLTRDTEFTAPGAEVIHDLTEVPEDAVVVGGESVYRQLLPRCSTALSSSEPKGQARAGQAKARWTE